MGADSAQEQELVPFMDASAVIKGTDCEYSSEAMGADSAQEQELVPFMDASAVIMGTAMGAHKTEAMEVESAQEPELAPFMHALPVIKRNGTIWTAVAHIITGVIGSGVLSLAWSMAQLGWIAGPLAMLFFASITLLSTFLLCDCYRCPDSEFGPSRNRSYLDAVRAILGKWNALICGLFAQVGLYGTGIAYTLTSAISMRAIQKSNCHHIKGHEAACEYGSTSFMLLFGAVQLVLSQLPDFHNIQWLSIVAAVMSFAYSIVGFALGFAKVIENGYVKGSVAGISAYTAADKVWNISQALGDIAFAYPYGLIIFEIQDTLRSPPSENKTMKKASTIAVMVTTFFYIGCGGFGYAAFGENTPGNLLAGFEFFEPYWIVDFANACIVVHLVGGYQVFSQPLFANIESWIHENNPSSRFIKTNVTYKLPYLPAFQLNLLRLCFRTIYVASTTMIAMLFPYFNQIIGLLGALGFWPLTIYFPVEMYCKQRNIEAWTNKWIMLQIFSITCFFVTVFALIGSIEGLINARSG